MQVTEAKVLAALSHPSRSRVLEVLKVHGAATVGMLTERTGEAVGNVSHHVKVLAECGLLVELPERARDRRERWWDLAQDTLSWSTADFQDDPAGAIVAAAAASLNLERHAAKVRDWQAVPEGERAGWTEGPFSTDSWAQLSDAELAEVGRQVVALFHSWADREVPDDGAARRTVFLFSHGVPAEP
jgi:DNA-binding transcriptional ArsR family regulator